MQVWSEVEVMQTLRQAREKAGLTREQLAQKTNGLVTSGTIYRIERDKSSALPAVRVALAQALGVAVSAIEWPAKERDSASE
jgi:transcriptional regulator with XRE-family HTH domain